MKIFVLNWKDRMRVYKITIEEDLGVALPNHFSKTEIVARDDRYDTKSAAREEFFARYVAYDFHDSCILMNAIDESFLEVEELHGVDKVIGYIRSITPNVLHMLFFLGLLGIMALLSRSEQKRWAYSFHVSVGRVRHLDIHAR
jgi:hypothetical protein